MKLNQLQKDFLANVTHELKTPLASLELSSQMLHSSELSSEEKEELWSSHADELQRLKEDIDHLLTASRWEQFSQEPKFEALNLENWIEKQVGKWQKIYSKKIEISFEGDSLDFLVSVDPKLLNLICRNIVDNARKFAQSHPARLEIRKSVATHDDPPYQVWKIEFQDEGIGFDPKQNKDIFKRFKRLSGATQKSIPGTGLGMHLAYSAARVMDLDLRAKSAGHGKGATFILEGQAKSPQSSTSQKEE